MHSETTGIMRSFPFPKAREKQIKALEFIERAVGRGYRDIVIAAPTGIGKTGIGVTAALWSVHDSLNLQGSPGGYYLVTQKMLQEQLATDFDKFTAQFRTRSASLKSSSEYTCHAHGTCMAGGRARPRCGAKRQGGCPYANAVSAFNASPVAVTNYAYFMTEKTHIGKFSDRRMLILDECHTVEKQLLGFVDVSIGTVEMEEWAPHIGEVPMLTQAEAFCDWLESEYIPCIADRLELKLSESETAGPTGNAHKQVQMLQNHLGRLQTVLNSLRNDPENWVYWQETEQDGIHLRSNAKPIEAAPFVRPLLASSGDVRVYMSAYPGEKDVFCRSLGLERDKVAWCSLGSTFPVENRPIHLYYCGSMGRSSIAQTTPGVLRMIRGIMRQHADEKGIIHCHTYKLGCAIADFFAHEPESERLLFARTAAERRVMLQRHLSRDEPTVLISPSMTEGFSLDDDAARWQVIAKVAYPYLGDRQVKAKQERDPDWYAMQAAMTVIQAAGRIVRSEEDWGVTYVLDSDFDRLVDRHPQFFPAWFTSAFVRH